MADELRVTQAPIDCSAIFERIVKGSDWDTSLYYGPATNPTNTTGWTMSVLFQAEDGTDLFTLTIGDGITMTAALGKFAITLSAARTATLKQQRVKFQATTTTDTGAVKIHFIATIEVYHPLE